MRSLWKKPQRKERRLQPKTFRFCEKNSRWGAMISNVSCGFHDTHRVRLPLRISLFLWRQTFKDRRASDLTVHAICPRSSVDKSGIFEQNEGKCTFCCDASTSDWIVRDPRPFLRRFRNAGASGPQLGVRLGEPYFQRSGRGLHHSDRPIGSKNKEPAIPLATTKSVPSSMTDHGEKGKREVEETRQDHQGEHRAHGEETGSGG